MGVRETTKSTALGLALEPIRLNYCWFSSCFPLLTPSSTPLRKGEAGETNWVPTDLNRRFEPPAANVSKPRRAV